MSTGAFYLDSALRLCSGHRGQAISALDSINALSNERQALWRLAGRQKLTLRQQERIQFLHKRIALLWDLRRWELAAAKPVSTEKRVDAEVFADFKDRQQPLQPIPGEDEWGHFHLEIPRPKRVFEPEDYPDVYVSPAFKRLTTEVLLEVLVSLRRRDQRRAAVRKKRHDLPLGRLQKRQRMTSHTQPRMVNGAPGQ